MVKFSNPRLKATFTDWPLGSTKRGTCIFEVHTEKRGVRVSRTTTGKPKYHTYGGKAAIVDGDDGKTYILQLTKPEYGPFISVSKSDFMTPDRRDGIPSAVFPDEAMFPELLGLINAAE